MVTRSTEPKKNSRMIGSGSQNLSVEATEELMKLIKHRNDSDCREKIQFRKLPHPDDLED